MKKFLAVYTGTKTGANAKKWEALDPNARKKREQEGMTAWMNWVNDNKKFITDTGNPLGKTKQADANGISDIRNNLTAYTIVEAETHDDAVALFKNHPHFAIFPGDTIEVMECLPIPKPQS
jgi:hypothetical protein